MFKSILNMFKKKEVKKEFVVEDWATQFAKEQQELRDDLIKKNKEMLETVQRMLEDR